MFLILKIHNKDTSKYKSLTLDSKLSFKDAIECYQTIVGACEVGIKTFLEKREIKITNIKYSIKDIIYMTRWSYGHDEFKQFFKNKLKQNINY